MFVRIAGTQPNTKKIVNNGGAAIAAPSRKDRPKKTRHARAVSLKAGGRDDCFAGTERVRLKRQRLLKAPTFPIGV